MRSRRLATSGGGVPGEGKVGARAPGWDAVAPPSASFHSGVRLRSGAPRGLESGHARRLTHPPPAPAVSAPLHRPPPAPAVSAPLRRAVPWGPGPARPLEADLETQGAFLCACGLSRRFFRGDRSIDGAGWGRTAWAPCGSPAGVCP